MKQEDIIKATKNSLNIYSFTAEALEKLIDTVAATEREACAKLCEQEYDTGLTMAPESPALAAAIRARRSK